MKHYTSENRGTFQSQRYARQIISFEGMLYPGRYGLLNVTPTDIDGFVQSDTDGTFIFFEIKHEGSDIPSGQRRALESLVDAITKKEAILFLAHHKDDGPVVMAKDTIVKRYYWRGHWWYLHGRRTLNEAIEKYRELIREIKPCLG